MYDELGHRVSTLNQPIEVYGPRGIGYCIYIRYKSLIVALVSSYGQLIVQVMDPHKIIWLSMK